MDAITAMAGRPYGHVPGHQYLDVEVAVRGTLATLLIAWGSAQGRDEEHGREQYSRRGVDAADAVEKVRDAALSEQRGESRRYVETACSEAILRIAAAVRS